MPSPLPRPARGATTSDLSTREPSASRAAGPHTASAAVRSQPPAKTDRRHSTSRSAASSSSQDQSTTARRVCWRGRAVRLPEVRRRKRSSSRSAIWRGVSIRSRAAASSMARGRPSRRRQISAHASGSSSVRKPGRAAAPRSANRRSATGSGKGSTGRSNSPRTLRGSRLVARTVRPGQRSRRVSTRRAAASTTCSQLSRISSMRRGPQCSASRSTGALCRSVTARMLSAPAPYSTVWRAPTAVRTASGTAPGWSTGASSASHTPSGWAARTVSAASCDSLAPGPPGPRSVTRRAAGAFLAMFQVTAADSELPAVCRGWTGTG
ncbi:hypothetical protein STENM223S_08564 [Streptomyces tendae]